MLSRKRDKGGAPDTVRGPDSREDISLKEGP